MLKCLFRHRWQNFAVAANSKGGLLVPNAFISGRRICMRCGKHQLRGYRTDIGRSIGGPLKYNEHWYNNGWIDLEKQIFYDEQGLGLKI